jgi:hypothetical protein
MPRSISGIGWVAMVLLVGCGGATAPEEPANVVPDKCQKIHVDRLAGDWIQTKGQAANHRVRMRVMEKGDGYEGWYIGGFFPKRRMKGEKRKNEVVFTEVPTPERAKRFKKGEFGLERVYVKPSLKHCALQVFAGSVTNDDKESIPPRGEEMVEFPDMPGVTFSYRPPDRVLFLGEAAKNADKAAKQLKENEGAPKSDHELGVVPVGFWSVAAEDGAADCTYSMELYFDDQLKTELSREVTTVENDKRHWYLDWDAPYSGNHHFEMYRYRVCGGGEKELIDVAALEAVLL